MSEAFDEGTGEKLEAQAFTEQDFLLTAYEAADLLGEELNEKFSVARFRRLVMSGDAPAVADKGRGIDKWSQAALDRWIESYLPDTPAAEEAAAVQAAEPKHRDVYEFFERTYSPYYELADARISALNREKPLTSWCDQWWVHRSVVARLVASWYAWEDAFAAGGGAMSSWILEHADRHYDRIMAEDGPFRKCKSGHTDDLDEYRTIAAPDALRLHDEAKDDPNIGTPQ